MYHVFIKLSVWLGFSLALGGCVVSHVPFNPAENQHIRSVVVVSIPTPPAATIRNFGSPMALVGGGIGAFAAMNVSASENKDPFQQLLVRQGFDFGKEMQEAIAGRLRKMGYAVRPVQMARENPYRLLGEYEKVPAAGADAILDCANGTYFGYSNVSMMDRKFRPHIHVYVRLVDAKTKKVLYEDEILYGYTNPFMTAAKLSAPDKYFYDSDEAVLADGRKTVEGLRVGIAQVADHIAVQLRGGTQAELK